MAKAKLKLKLLDLSLVGFAMLLAWVDLKLASIAVEAHDVILLGLKHQRNMLTLHLVAGADFLSKGCLLEPL